MSLTRIRVSSRQVDEKTRIFGGLGMFAPHEQGLYYFCTEYLGYDKLSLSFHAPMLAKWDAIDIKRSAGKAIDTLDLWPRDHIKTWCERARVIRYYIRNPLHTHTWWHAVEEMAQESCVSIAKQFQFNAKLRPLFEHGVLPSPSAKRFVNAKNFSLRSNRIGDAPSMRAWGAGSEATGGHSQGCTLDDPIGYNDVVDSQMPAKKRWYQATVCNVVRSDGFKDAIGTRWDPDDLYQGWLDSKHWISVTRSCLETNGEMDYAGEPVYLTRQQVEKKRDELGDAMFALQMMNDSKTKSLRSWDSSLCEHFIPLSQASGPGTLVLLSDPAPANIGSMKDLQYKQRGDGTKNEWAIALVKLRTNGQRREIILLDGKASKRWDLDQGYAEIFAMIRKWTNAGGAVARLAEESTGQAIALYEKTRREAARKAGIRYIPIDLAGTYEGSAKKVYFGALVSKAKQDEFLIADSVPSDFLSPEDHEGFLYQCRMCVFYPNGRNNLRLDDRMNVVSFATDPAVKNLSPSPGKIELTPFTRVERDTEGQGSLHVQWE